MSAGPTAGAPHDDVAASLVDLLGEQRATVVRHLRQAPGATVAELAEILGISEVATRRHLAVLEAEGFVATETVRQPRGRPVARYRLTDRARDLFPQRYADVAAELIDFITTEQGREGLRSFLRWRLERETEAYEEAVTADDPRDRVEQLADALSAAGYEATVRERDGRFVLVQDHCAIYEVARHHPEMCAYEAATFRRVLGRDVSVSRRETLANGHPACVCTVTPRVTTSDAPGASDDPDQT